MAQIDRVARVFQYAQDLAAPVEPLFKLASKKHLGDTLAVAQVRVCLAVAAAQAGQQRRLVILDKRTLRAEILRVVNAERQRLVAVRLLVEEGDDPVIARRARSGKDAAGPQFPDARPDGTPGRTGRLET